MSKAMIENSDRGITVDKRIAWAIVSGLVFGGFATGSTLVSIQGSLAVLNRAVEGQREVSEARESRMRTLENSVTRYEERVANMLALLSRIDGRLERIERSQLDAR